MLDVTEKDHKCDFCEKLFPDFKFLEKHISEIHEHTKTINCEKCPTTFKSMSKLKTHMENCKDIQRHSYGREDGMGRKSTLSLWNIAGDDVAGIVAR